MKPSPLLALFARSLREDGRHKLIYFGRVGLILLILLFLLMLHETFGWGNAPGLSFFSTVIYLDFWFIVLAGFSYFASAITEEKEEMTLGLLRMTNLNPLSILLGKSTSRLIGALLLLAAQLPFTFLAVSLGGVAVNQILAAYCTLGAFTVFLCNLCLLTSVIHRRTATAAALTALILFAAFAVVPFLQWVISLPSRFGMAIRPRLWVKALGALAHGIDAISPMNRLSAILSTGFADPPAGVQVWANLGLGALCFLIAWAIFEVCCGEQQEAGPARLVARRNSFFRGLGAARAWPRALAWKDFYFITGGKAWIVLKFIIYGAVLGAIEFVPRLWFNQQSWRDIGYSVMWLSSVVGLLELAFTASSVFGQERRWKTWSSLTMLPLSLGRIAGEKILGCLIGLLPITCIFLTGVICVKWSAHDPFGTSHWSTNDFLGWTLFLANVVFFLHEIVLLSLYLKRGAFPAAIAIHLVGYFTCAILAMLLRFGNGPFGDTNQFLICLLVLHLVGLAVMEAFIARRLALLAQED